MICQFPPFSSLNLLQQTGAQRLYDVVCRENSADPDKMRSRPALFDKIEFSLGQGGGGGGGGGGRGLVG